MKNDQKSRVQYYGVVLHSVDDLGEITRTYFRTDKTDYETFQDDVDRINKSLDAQSRDVLLALRLGKALVNPKFYGICCILDTGTFRRHIKE